MQVVCLDLEGVLVPEIWIEFSGRKGDGIPGPIPTWRSILIVSPPILIVSPSILIVSPILTA